MLGPRFRAIETWDNSGDIDIWFVDHTSQDLRDRVCRELNDMIPRLHKHAKSIYHVEGLVWHIFHKMSSSGNLRVNNRTRQWVWVEEVQLCLK